MRGSSPKFGTIENIAQTAEQIEEAEVKQAKIREKAKFDDTISSILP